MADNIVLNAGAGGSTLATDDITGVHYQIIKLAYGALETATLVEATVGLPVDVLDRAARDLGGVDILTAIPAGTNNIGDVDVLSVIPGTGATNLGKAIDTAVGATDTGVLILARRDDALGALTPLESDAVELRTDANGALWTHDDALDAALAGSELQVDIVAALPAGTNNIGDVDVLTIAAGDNNIGNVDIVSGTITTVTTLTGGGIAHDSADSGNPHKIGARAVSVLETATLVAAADRTDLVADLDGGLISGRAVPYGDLLSERVSNTDGAATALTTFGAPGVGIRNYITTITVHNAHATTNGYVDIRDGTAGTVQWTIPLPATGGAVVPFNPPLRQLTTNTALAFDVSAAITTIYLSFNGFQSKL